MEAVSERSSKLVKGASLIVATREYARSFGYLAGAQESRSDTARLKTGLSGA